MPFGSASASGIKLHPPPKPPKREKEPLLPPPNPNPNPNPSPNSDPVTPSMPTGEGSSANAALSQSQFLSREELLRRRYRRIKQLAWVYRRRYWALIEEVRVKHRDYHWEFGKSPVEKEEGVNENGEPAEKNAAGERKRCGFSGCKSKAMPLTRFCHQHILADSKQTLYKPCAFVTKSAQSVHITCGKPVLRATVPCLCPMHFQKIQKQISQALKKAGVNSSGGGSMVGAICGSTQREPFVVGKPSTFMMDYLSNKFGILKSQICMVGDRLDTDILFGQNGSCKTPLVLSGVTSLEMLQSPSNSTQPDFYTNKVSDLLTLKAATV